MVFSMQALGLIVGPLVGLDAPVFGRQPPTDLAAHAGPRCRTGRRLSSTCGRRCPSRRGSRPRSRDRADRPASDLAAFSEGVVDAASRYHPSDQRLGLGQFLGNRRMLVLLIGTAGSWFLFDYAYYGNTLSLPAILKEVDSTASLGDEAAVDPWHLRRLRRPGYLLAVMTMDRIGHRRLQFIGFAVMAVAFLTLAAIRGPHDHGRARSSPSSGSATSSSSSDRT